MTWLDILAEKINNQQLQTINDSKTPSGRVHVGALRGVLIHDAIFRTLKERGVPVRYLFGVDDYDPLDELPSGQEKYFEKYLGVPLCNVPSPPSSDASDMAEYYIREFFDIFRELGVHAETYRMRDIYRSGKFNEPIDTILRNAATVRRVYNDVSNAERPNTWHPFQVICQECGRIGTTEITSYDGKEVTYWCRMDLVGWAKGCSYKGRVSPFNGNGKLPWKLEWVAKWATFPVTIEGAGKDHTTKGGSREVASKCLQEIFHLEPPINIPYEFFLVGGAKMSSSRGIGASAREISDLLPPETLRFLILKTHPKRPVNFSLDEQYIVKLFNDFDRYHWRTYNAPKVKEEERQVYLLSEVTPEGNYYDANFQLILALVQMPHLDVVKEIEKRKGALLTEIELRHLNQRVHTAQHWLENYARDEEKMLLQQSIPDRAHTLTSTQIAFLHKLATALPSTKWEDEALQAKIFDVVRLTPIETPVAFQAIYRVLLDQESGPKAGSFLAFLDMFFVIQRFKELSYSKVSFWRETGINIEEFENWLQKENTRIDSACAHFELLAVEVDLPSTQLGQHLMVGTGVIELSFTFNDSKTYLKRILFSQFRGIDINFEEEKSSFRYYADEYVKDLAKKYNINIRIQGTRSKCENFTNIQLKDRR